MKLIAIDLDDTLLSEDCTISRINAEAIRQVQDQGDIVVACSGRSVPDIEQILHKAGLECPIISGNGAVTRHGGEEARYLALSPETAADVAGILEEEGFYYEIYTNRGIYILKNGRDILQAEIEAALKKDPDYPVDWAERKIEIQYNQHGMTTMGDFGSVDYADVAPYKLFVMSFDGDALASLRDRLSDRADISITSSGDVKLELGHPETSKGNAVLALADMMEITQADIVAMGIT
nr:HAD hydrolase family protein [Planococcus lenghuensis]